MKLPAASCCSSSPCHCDRQITADYTTPLLHLAQQLHDTQKQQIYRSFASLHNTAQSLQMTTVTTSTQSSQRLDCSGWIEAVARLSSWITNASASGFIPLSHNRTQIANVSASSPVFSNDDISIKISNVSLAAFDLPASLSAMFIYIE